jgi:hypothetical protein
VTKTRRDQAAYESFLTLTSSQSALVTEILEDWTDALDDAMRPMGGTVIHRRLNDAATNAAFGGNDDSGYRHPCYHGPICA